MGSLMSASPHAPGEQSKESTVPIPTNNPFLKITPEKQEKIRQNLFRQLQRAVNHLTMPACGEKHMMDHLFEELQNVLRKFAEFGYDVKLIDETLFPDLKEAVSILKRAALEDEIREIIEKLLAECNLPKTPATAQPKRVPGSERMVPATSGL